MENTESQIINFARVGATDREIADALGIPEERLLAKYKTQLAKTRAELNIKLRHKQYQMALDGDKPILLWFAKTRLDQPASRPDSDASADFNIDPAKHKDDTDDHVFDHS